MVFGRKHLQNEKGQTSIFVALIFQVLFVLFAMALNIGMVVHDKINLQNSVDLAAYYAAQRQAEWMNAIAHTNYQIRQAFKLFAFRYKVLGTLGMNGQLGAPLHPAFTNTTTEQKWDYAEKPVACIAHGNNWDTKPKQDNICRQMFKTIPALGKIIPVASFNPINMLLQSLTNSIQGRLDSQCATSGSVSWYWAAAAAQSYRSDQYNRLKTIEQFANVLSMSSPWDINGGKIATGARKTLEKNLTSGNLGGIQSVKMYNSLKGLPMEAWLSKILIQPTVWYIDVDNSSGCRGEARDIVEPPQIAFGVDYIKTKLQAEDLLKWMDSMNSFITGSDYSYTLGVEKNPWVMAYMGVEATTISRPIFFPFGDGVELTARAFAKPFGGKIGPWYYKTWAPNANMSSGERIDNMAPARLNPTGSFLDGSDTSRLPDYSKYPGDELGLKSYMAQNSLNGLINKRNMLTWYSDTWKNIDAAVPTTADRLPWDKSKNESPLIRNYEIAAIAPDLFDITYYSIEPNYYDNYLASIEANKNKILSDPSVILRGDLGSRPGTNLAGFSVQDQIKMAEASNNNVPGVLRKSDVFYFVRDKSDLLTDWMSGPNHGNPGNYFKIDTDFFGECQVPDDDTEFKSPGSCHARGGRTGYSVKLVSKDSLLSSEWPVGGGNEKGALLNPPKDDGWVDF